MTKIDILSGFLGAGKTTLIKKLIAEAYQGEKLVLIENEFGEIGIDGGFMKDAGVEVTEMNSGCICCSLVGDFGTALKKVIVDYAPDRVIIEPSGVGKLSDVMKAVEDAKQDADVVINSATTVVDVAKCKMYMKNFGEFFNNQVESAGTIVLSRTQNVPEKKVNDTVAMLREHNKDAAIITTPWDDIDGKVILDAMEHANTLDKLIKEAVEIARKHEEEHHHHDHDHDHEEHEHHHDHEHEEHDHASENHEGHNHEAEMAAGHSDEIILAPEKAKAAGVESEIIRPESFRQVITTSGQVQAAQGDESVVVANVAGVVSFRHPVTDGMSVSKGAPILNISAENMPDGAPVKRTRIAYETAKKEYERAAKLVKSQIISQKDFNAIKESYENALLAYEAISKNQTKTGVSVTAPLGGYIKNCLVQEGDYVSVGQPLVSITQNRRLFLRADVSEKYYGYLHSIQSANFKTPYDNKVYELGELKGHLLSYGKASGGTSFYVPVTFEFDNRGDVIPGSYVEVYLLSSEMPDVLALPVTALTEEQGLYFVYLQLDEEGYKKQEVTLGASNGKKVQILTGLKAGDRVVTKGAYQVKLASASNAIPAHSHEH